jgi:hypothetical protein
MISRRKLAVTNPAITKHGASVRRTAPVPVAAVAAVAVAAGAVDAKADRATRISAIQVPSAMKPDLPPPTTAWTAMTAKSTAT